MPTPLDADGPAEEEADANKLRSQLRQAEQDRALESRQLNSKIDRLKAVQNASLAAGSARGRALLYAEQRKARQQSSCQLLKEGTNSPREADAENLPPGAGQ